MPNRIIKVLSTFSEIVSRGETIFIVASVSPSDLDRLAEIASDLEDNEDDGHTEAELTTDGWSA